MLAWLSKNQDVMYSWLNQGGRILLALVILPFALANLEAPELTVWFLLATLVSIGQSLLYGFTSTFVRFISYSRAGVKVKDFRNILSINRESKCFEVNEHELANIIHVLKLVFCVLTCFYLIVISSIGFLALNKPISVITLPHQGWLAWGVVLSTSAICIYACLYQVILEGHGQVKLVQKIGAISNIVGTGFVLVVLSFNTNILSLVISYQLVIITNYLIVVYFSKRQLRYLKSKIESSEYEHSIFINVLECAWKSGITAFVSTGTKHISSLLVAQLFAASSAATFLLTKRLFDILETFTGVTFQAKNPRLIGLRGTGDIGAYHTELRNTIAISYGVFLSGFAVVLYFGESLLGIIDKGTSLGDCHLVVVFGLAGLLSRWSAMCFSSANHANQILEHIAIFISTVAFYISLYLTYPEFGLVSFPASTIFATLAVMPLTINKVYPLMNTKFMRFESKLLIPAICVWGVFSFVYQVLTK